MKIHIAECLVCHYLYSQSFIGLVLETICGSLANLCHEGGFRMENIWLFDYWNRL